MAVFMIHMSHWNFEIFGDYKYVYIFYGGKLHVC